MRDRMRSVCTTSNETQKCHHTNKKKRPNDPKKGCIYLVRHQYSNDKLMGNAARKLGFLDGFSGSPVDDSPTDLEVDSSLFSDINNHPIFRHK